MRARIMPRKLGRRSGRVNRIDRATQAGAFDLRQEQFGGSVGSDTRLATMRWPPCQQFSVWRGDVALLLFRRARGGMSRPGRGQHPRRASAFSYHSTLQVPGSMQRGTAVCVASVRGAVNAPGPEARIGRT